MQVFNDLTYGGTAFTGTFDGKGYKIKGYTASVTASEYPQISLFGKTKDATFKNLTLSDVNINVKSDYGAQVSALANGSATCSKVTVTGKITVSGNETTSWDTLEYDISGLCNSGILKDYNKTLTKKELCRLVVQWYQAMGNKLPKQKTTSPFKDTKDKYVIMAHQLGIIKSTSNKKFSPDEALTEGTYNEIVSRLMEVTGSSADAGAVAKKNSGWNGSKVRRDEAIARLYKALVPSFQTEYLVSDSQVGYMIAPYDNQNVCLDVWEESKKEGATIGLWECKGSNNQRFFIDYDGGNYSLKNVNSLYTLSFSGNQVCQRLQGYKSQIITLEYNSDGSVYIRNGYGQYLDIEGGSPVSGGTVTFKEKSGSSSQKFVFKF